MALRMATNDQGLGVIESDGDEHPGQPPTTYIPEGVVADLLMYAAVDADSIGCREEFCPDCNPMRTVWWEAMNSLSAKTRQATQALMRDAGVALVPGPYNEEPFGVVPSTQHG